MRNRLAFACVFGIAGVGKSTLIRSFVESHSDWRSLAAGQLLARATRHDPEQLRTTVPAAIQDNQYLLVDIIREFRDREPEMNWILDAHSVINNGKEIVLVPTDVVVRLEPTHLIFLRATPEQILERRRMDTTRARPMSSVKLIAEEQELACKAVLGYSDALKLYLHRIDANDAARFEEALLKEQQQRAV